MPDPTRLLTDLNDAQVEAVRCASGPLVILAGAGTGKTRVVSRRAAWAIENGIVREDRTLLVTFTKKAADEMVERMSALGHPGVMARTFHAMALAQLSHFWPRLHDGAEIPAILESKVQLVRQVAKSTLPSGRPELEAKDLAAAIEWAKVRRIPPERWVAEGGDHAPVPAELFARLYERYEREKERRRVIDFEDVLVRMVEALETDEELASIVRSRKTWISVDEYQDTNPLAERLLELWLGESRDLAVVGDPNQTIYTFAGASPTYLLGFARRHPGARTVALIESYRSTPEVVALANRLIAPPAERALRATRPAGPAPQISAFADADEERAAIAAGIERLRHSGVSADEIAVLVRVNAQLAELEPALTRAGIPFTLRGGRFFERREVVEARKLLREAHLASQGEALVGAIREVLAALGLPREQEGAVASTGAEPEVGEETRERIASLEMLVAIAADLVAREPTLTPEAFLKELERRDHAEAAAGSDGGVNLLTYHRAKGLEWDAVFLPALEEGYLPIGYAKEDAEIDEERRLLYVGITRARTHLAISWAASRRGRQGRATGRRPSRYLASLQPPTTKATTTTKALTKAGAKASGRVRVVPDGSQRSRKARADVDPLFEALRQWRLERAKRDGVPAYAVAHDETLNAIVEAKPATVAALRRCRGIGPERLARYGAEILAVVAAST